ncbi:MAG: tetratricopeptide repeat protein [Deltaproteobacteria bacterium]|nr:tetratricopeptide repeat protein [Deltaproteobacteria bacterium]
MYGKSAYLLLQFLLIFFSLGNSSCSKPGEKQLALASSLAFKGEYTKAVQAYDAALNKLPKAAYYQRVSANLRAGELSRLFLKDYRRAISYFRKVRELDKGELGFKARVAIAEIMRFDLGDIRAAIVEYQNLVKAYPGHPNLANYQLEISRCYNSIGDHRQARVEAEVVRKRYKGTRLEQQAVILIADSLSLDGNTRAAIKEYEGFLKRFPDSRYIADVAFSLANCYEDLGESDLAQTRLAEIAAKIRNPKMIEKKMQRIKARARNMGR